MDAGISCAGRVGGWFENVVIATQKTIKRVVEVKDDPDALGKVLKIAGYIFMAFQYYTNRPMSLLARNLTTCDTLIDSVQSGGDLNYWINGDAAKDTQSKRYAFMAFKVGVTIADAGGLLMWLDHLKIIELAKWGAALANKVPFFRPVYNVGLATPLTVLVGLSFGCFAIDAYLRLRNSAPGEKDSSAKKQAYIDIAWAVTEIAAKVFVLVQAVTAVTALTVGITVALGICAAALGLTSFVYSKLQEESEAKKQLGIAS